MLACLAQAGRLQWAFFFNIEQTVKMLGLINRHFGSTQSQGAIDAWRDRKDDVDPRKANRKELTKIAKEYEIHPDASGNPLGRTKGR
jgi:hypothetical protein